MNIEALAGGLTASILSDCLDQCGFKHQALPSRIRPLDENLVMMGRARTAVFMEVYSDPSDSNPYELEIELIDSLNPGDIPIFACSNPIRIAPWGELLSTASRNRGAAGAVFDGCVRDIKAVRNMRFPVFHAGIAPLDSRGRGKVMAIDVPIECAGVEATTGDFIFGDADGVVVVPRVIEPKVVERAREKIKGERFTLRALQQGETLASVYSKYGVL